MALTIPFKLISPLSVLFEGDAVLLQGLPVTVLQGTTIGNEDVIAALCREYRRAHAAFTTT